MNKALSGLYPPGSTIKTIVALSALENDVLSPKLTVECKGSIDFYGEKFHCWKNKFGHGNVNIYDDISQSCDVFFYEIALKTGINNIARISREFGPGNVTGLNLPGERTGLIPDRDWKLKAKNLMWRPGETIIAPVKVARSTINFGLNFSSV